MIFPVPDGLDKLIGKGLGGYIHHPCLVIVVMYVVADGLNQMSFSKPNSPVNEAWVVSGARVLRDGDTRICRKRVVVADNKVLKAVIDAQLIVLTHFHLMGRLRQRLAPRGCWLGMWKRRMSLLACLRDRRSSLSRLTRLTSLTSLGCKGSVGCVGSRLVLSRLFRALPRSAALLLCRRRLCRFVA